MNNFKIIFFLGFIFLTGCSSITGGTDNTPNPRAIGTVENRIALSKEWSKNIGKVKKDLYLDFYPELYSKSIYNYIFTASYNGKISVINNNSGSTIWSKKYPYKFSSAVYHYGNKLFAGTIKGQLIAVNSDNGQLLWKTQLSTSILAAPVSDGKRLFVQTADGAVVALDLHNGNQIWSYEIKIPELILRGTSQPIVKNGKVVVGFATGKLVALNSSDGSEAWNYEVSLPRGNNIIDNLSDIDSKILVNNDILYTVSYNGNLAAVDLDSGHEIWARGMSAFRSLSQDSKNIYVVDSESKIWSINKKNGAVNWVNDIFLYHYLTSPALLNGNIFVGDKLGYVYGLNAKTGETLAAIKLYNRNPTLSVTATNNHLLALGGSGTLVAVKVS